MPPKAGFGTGTRGIKRAAEANAAATDAAPAPKLGKREPVLLDELRVEVLDVGLGVRQPPPHQTHVAPQRRGLVDARDHGEELGQANDALKELDIRNLCILWNRPSITSS